MYSSYCIFLPIINSNHLIWIGNHYELQTYYNRLSFQCILTSISVLVKKRKYTIFSVLYEVHFWHIVPCQRWVLVPAYSERFGVVLLLGREGVVISASDADVSVTMEKWNGEPALAPTRRTFRVDFRTPSI